MGVETEALVLWPLTIQHCPFQWALTRGGVGTGITRKHGKREWFIAVHKKAIKYFALSCIRVLIGMIKYHWTWGGNWSFISLLLWHSLNWVDDTTQSAWGLPYQFCFAKQSQSRSNSVGQFHRLTGEAPEKQDSWDDPGWETMGLILGQLGRELPKIFQAPGTAPSHSSSLHVLPTLTDVLGLTPYYLQSLKGRVGLRIGCIFSSCPVV